MCRKLITVNLATHLPNTEMSSEASGNLGQDMGHVLKGCGLNRYINLILQQQ